LKELTVRRYGKYPDIIFENSFTIENSYSGRKMLHSGMGLSNIRAAVEKYHGAMEIRTEGEKFVLSILVIIPQQSENISQQAS